MLKQFPLCELMGIKVNFVIFHGGLKYLQLFAVVVVRKPHEYRSLLFFLKIN